MCALRVASLPARLPLYCDSSKSLYHRVSQPTTLADRVTTVVHYDLSLGNTIPRLESITVKDLTTDFCFSSMEICNENSILVQ